MTAETGTWDDGSDGQGHTARRAMEVGMWGGGDQRDGIWLKKVNARQGHRMKGASDGRDTGGQGSVGCWHVG